MSPTHFLECVQLHTNDETMNSNPAVSHVNLWSAIFDLSLQLAYSNTQEGCQTRRAGRIVRCLRVRARLHCYQRTVVGNHFTRTTEYWNHQSGSRSIGALASGLRFSYYILSLSVSYVSCNCLPARRSLGVSCLHIITPWNQLTKAAPVNNIEYEVQPYIPEPTSIYSHPRTPAVDEAWTALLGTVSTLFIV